MEFTNEHILLRPMTQEDIPFAMKLKSVANWNQLEADWKLLIDAGDGGNFVATYAGKEIGTITTLTYQNRFSWLGMVLVDPAYRGMGAGRTLLQTAIAHASSKGTVRLDATPQGKKLYETLGFITERQLIRLERQPANHPLLHVSQTCTAISANVLLQLLEFDFGIFGANREVVLCHLFHQAPAYAYYAERKGKITGYCFGRSGSHFEHIGPMIAENKEDARDLLLSVAAACPDKSLIIDVFTEHSQWLDMLDSLGFKIQRPFIRMYLGKLSYPGNPAMQYAIAGPELG